MSSTDWQRIAADYEQEFGLRHEICDFVWSVALAGITLEARQGAAFHAAAHQLDRALEHYRRTGIAQDIEPAMRRFRVLTVRTAFRQAFGEWIERVAA